MRKFMILLVLLTMLATLTGGAAAQDVPDPAITITSPGWGALVTDEGTITVSGVATNLFEGGLVVQALDATGIILAEQPTTAVGAALGGTGSWTVNLPVTGIAAGTTGQIFAFSTSAMDGSIEAQASVTVTFGSVPAVGITITSPVNGTIINPANGIVITGTTQNIFEAQFMLEVRDAASNVLAQVPVTSSTSVGAGTWQTVVNLQFPEITAGTIYAYDVSSIDNTVVASATVTVTFQANCTPNTTWPLYTVVVGDNLFRIAERTGSTMDELAQANCITNRSVIVVGQQLRVPRLPDGAGSGTASSAQLAITSPGNNDAVAPGTVVVNGTGALLFENGLAVRLLDDQGLVFAEQPTTLANLQADGSGVWQVAFNATGYQGKYVTAVAYSVGGYGSMPLVSNSINLFLGQPAATYITIDTPGAYANIGSTMTFPLSGQAKGAFEGTVLVAAYDSTGRLLASTFTTAAAPDLGQPGPWSVNLTVNVAAGTHGWVEAYEQSARDGSVINLTRRDVVFGEGSVAAPFVTIDMPLPWDHINLVGGGFAGRLGGIPANARVWVRVLNDEGNVMFGPWIGTVTPDGGWHLLFEGGMELGIIGEEGTLVVYFTDPVSGVVLAYDAVPVVFQP